MTRFNITMKEAISTVMWSLERAIGGEIIVPKLFSYKIMDLAAAVNGKKKIEFIGTRAGEKLHEEMISLDDSLHAINLKKYYLILPFNKNKFKNIYTNEINLLKKRKPFSYNSLENNYISIDQLKKIINTEIHNKKIEI